MNRFSPDSVIDKEISYGEDFVVLKISDQETSNSLTKGDTEMRVSVNPELCGGCGPCVDICPEAFELNEEGLAVTKVDEVPTELEETCREAANDCPTEAITIEE